ncbi:MAG TPA: hypothetical protein VK206_22900 [Anaerolineales bacterium]|nr:hypothetical protein [Anaerolineales bacterium]HLO28578.1 hypothetical protein [Anaerolineales bacterium]
MPIKVKELRLSFVWTKSFSKDVLMPYLSDSGRYKREFNQAILNQGSWSLPWLPGERQHFWQYYLNTAEIGDLEKVDAERAWKFLIPLRAPASAQIPPTNDMRISFEGFCFPHSVGVIATIFIHPLTTGRLIDTVGRAVKARHTQYNVLWRDNGTKTHGSLQSLAGELIDKLHQKALGETPQGERLSEPITIATVVDASGAWAAKPGKEKTTIDRALFGLCRLEAGWEKGGMAGLIDSDFKPVTEGRRPEDQRLYALERARAIWLPEHFADTPVYSEEAQYSPRARALGCYHRNLAIATLQAQSLVKLVKRAFDFLPQSQVSLQISGPVKRAVRILNSLYIGEVETYRSWSLKHQISYSVDLIKQVGQAIGEEWLEPAPEPEDED